MRKSCLSKSYQIRPSSDLVSDQKKLFKKKLFFKIFSYVRVMQGWLFHNDPNYWHKEQAKALLTSVPKVIS